MTASRLQALCVQGHKRAGSAAGRGRARPLPHRDPRPRRAAQLREPHCTDRPRPLRPQPSRNRNPQESPGGRGPRQSTPPSVLSARLGVRAGLPVPTRSWSPERPPAACVCRLLRAPCGLRWPWEALRVSGPCARGDSGTAVTCSGPPSVRFSFPGGQPGSRSQTKVLRFAATTCDGQENPAPGAGRTTGSHPAPALWRGHTRAANLDGPDRRHEGCKVPATASSSWGGAEPAPGGPARFPGPGRVQCGADTGDGSVVLLSPPAEPRLSRPE